MNIKVGMNLRSKYQVSNATVTAINDSNITINTKAGNTLVLTHHQLKRFYFIK